MRIHIVQPNELKQGIGRGPLGRVFHGLPGIVLSLVARTIPD